jgi:hypothetical protein
VKTLIFSILILAIQGHAADPRLERVDLRECEEVAKGFMRSSDYTGKEKQDELLGACRDVDPDCVQASGESFHPIDGSDSKLFIQLVRACRGKDMGKCFRSAAAGVASYDRREATQILSLLKKCE